MNYLPGNMHYLLKVYGARQQNLADFVKVSQNSISHWVNGLTSPNTPALISIRQFFGISIDTLIMVDLSKARIDLTENIKMFYKKGHAGGLLKGQNLPISLQYFLAADKSKARKKK